MTYQAPKSRPKDSLVVKFVNSIGWRKREEKDKMNDFLSNMLEHIKNIKH